MKEQRIKNLFNRVNPFYLFREIERVKNKMENIEKNQKNSYLKSLGLNNLELNEFKIYSQNGEDGVINYIFKKIGSKTKKFAEIGIEEGKECNTRNLVENFGWSGIMIEGNKKEAKVAMDFYGKYPVKIINTFVTDKNINNLIPKDVDLLSIDVDGSDYWLWKKLNAKPRMVIIEYNSTFGDKFITIPYSDKPRVEQHPDWLYEGAGLNALIKLGKEKGYKLVYANYCNAFFLRKEIKHFKELSFKEAYKESEMRRRLWGSPEEQFDLIKNRKFIKV